jgi:hypothetical protein
MGEIRNSKRILFWKPKENKPLEKSRRRREDDIKMELE